MLCWRTARPKQTVFGSKQRCIRLQPASRNVTNNKAIERSTELSRVDCEDSIRKYDSSSYLLSKFYPLEVRNTYVGVRALNIELSKLSTGLQNSSGKSGNTKFTELKFGFWDQQLDSLEQDALSVLRGSTRGSNTGEPVTMLLRETIRRGISLDIGMLRQMVTSHRAFFNNELQKGFDTVESMCSFGEGTYSQMNYLMHSALLSPKLGETSAFALRVLENPSSEQLRNTVSEIAAHLGQATGVASFLIGLKYYAQVRQQLMLPVDVLARRRVPQESVLRALQGSKEADSALQEALKDAIFEVATTANDHILAARTKLDLLRTQIQTVVDETGDGQLAAQLRQLKRGIPDALYLPYMSGIPTVCFLERLEKCDFNILDSNLVVKDWRLAWRTYRGYSRRVV